MLKHRIILLTLTIAIVPGSLASTIAYALHLRGRAFRERIAANLSERMQLAVEIGGVSPRSFTSRRFDDISVRLPGQDTRIAEIGHAVWRQAPDANGGDGFGLHLSAGWLLVGAGHWGAGDYQQLLRSGFGHDFEALRIEEITVDDLEFRWRHPDFPLTASRASGVIFFRDPAHGRAALSVYELNGTAMTEPVHVAAAFTPGEGMAFQKVELRVGDIPVQALGLDRLLGRPVCAGAFNGEITYRTLEAGGWTVEVGGALAGARLEELTGRVIGGPYQGAVDVAIEQALITPDSSGHPRVQALRFGGELTSLHLADFASLFREPDLNGRVDLTVHQADYDAPRLRHLRLSGKAADVSLEALTRLIGRGTITGRLEVRINALAIVDDVVQFADVDVVAVPPEHGVAYIQRDALATVGQRVFGLDLERVLPERVEYVEMGAKLLLDREGLRVRGTHGPDGRTLLTVRLWGREVGILKQPDRIYPVDDLVALVRGQLEDYDVDRVVEWWTRRHARSRPAED